MFRIYHNYCRCISLPRFRVISSDFTIWNQSVSPCKSLRTVIGGGFSINTSPYQQCSFISKELLSHRDLFFVWKYCGWSNFSSQFLLTLFLFIKINLTKVKQITECLRHRDTYTPKKTPSTILSLSYCIRFSYIHFIVLFLVCACKKFQTWR